MADQDRWCRQKYWTCPVFLPPPLAPARLTDDEIAIGDLLLRMADYINGGPQVYPLKHACQDHYLALICAKAIETGQPVKTATQPWAR